MLRRGGPGKTHADAGDELGVDEEPLPPDEFVPLTISFYYQGDAYRKGSRIQVTIAAPSGSQPIWAFDHAEPETGTTQVAIAYGGATRLEPAAASRARGRRPDGLPPCPGLRREPCRSCQAFANLPATH